MKKMLFILLTLIVLLFAYKMGVKHAIESAQISVYGNVVEIIVDGEAYTHVAE